MFTHTWTWLNRFYWIFRSHRANFPTLNRQWSIRTVHTVHTVQTTIANFETFSDRRFFRLKWTKMLDNYKFWILLHVRVVYKFRSYVQWHLLMKLIAIKIHIVSHSENDCNDCNVVHFVSNTDGNQQKIQAYAFQSRNDFIIDLLKCSNYTIVDIWADFIPIFVILYWIIIRTIRMNSIGIGLERLRYYVCVRNNISIFLFFLSLSLFADHYSTGVLVRFVCVHLLQLLRKWNFQRCLMFQMEIELHDT